jgi:TPR repeat protein
MRWNLAGQGSTLLVLAVCSLTVAGCGRGNQFAEGQAAYQARDFTKAASLFERACRDGEARACTSLGSMALNGETGRADASWARALYEKACQGGDAEGCGKLRAMTVGAVGPAPQVTQTTPAATAPTPPIAEATPEAAFVPTAQPSFDCTTARNQAERLICTDSDLARRDVELAHLYRRARHHAVDEGAVIAEQRDWIALRRNACTSKECLYRAYRHRTRELEDWIP